MKKATIELDSIKSPDRWCELGNKLGFSDEKNSKIFQYGEYGHIEIEVDENLNIVGGRIIPCNE